jgi:hypothetical protein
VSPSPFATMADMASNNLVLKPLLYRYFHEAQFPDEFTITYKKGQLGDRGPDGWFHPSEHPLMTERQLYYYLTDPDGYEGWKPDYAMRMATLMGSALHDFVEMCLIDLGLLMKPSGTCVACGRPQPSRCKEFGAIDRQTRSRGHTDGLLKTGKGFELKSAHPSTIQSVADNDLEAFKRKWPRYWAQQQEYQRMMGLEETILLFFGMGTPWEMREFLIPRDPVFQFQTEQKYLRAREAAEKGIRPEACCGPRSKMSKECPATHCEMKRL